MAGSDSPLQHLHSHLCPGVGCTLDCPFWHPNGYDFGQGFSVHLSAMGINLTVVGHQASSHDSLPPSVQRPCRAVPPSFEVRPAHPFVRTQLVGRVAMGTFGHQDSPQGGFGLFFGGTGIWCPSHCSWRLHR